MSRISRHLIHDSFVAKKVARCFFVAIKNLFLSFAAAFSSHTHSSSWLNFSHTAFYRIRETNLLACCQSASTIIIEVWYSRVKILAIMILSDPLDETIFHRPQAALVKNICCIEWRYAAIADHAENEIHAIRVEIDYNFFAHHVSLCAHGFLKCIIQPSIP